MKRNINFKLLERKMGIKPTKNNAMINRYIDHRIAKSISTDYYNLLMRQDEVYKHKQTGLIVVRTNKNKKIKIIDPYRLMELRIIKGDNDDYPFIVFDAKVYKAHKIICESYHNRLVGDGEDIHHLNHNKKCYDFENLVIIKRDEHLRLHRREG